MVKVLVTILLFLSTAKAQVINVVSFGAVPGKANNYTAFKRLSDTINARHGNTTVIIQPGTYYWKPPDTSVNKVWDLLSLTGCSNVTIVGAGKVIIKLMPGVPLGIKPAGAVHIGSVFRLTNCQNISIYSIQADGNQDGLRLLGPHGVGPNPYELEHDGLMMIGSSSINVYDCSFKNFARDGAMLLEQCDNNYFYNTVFNNNGRNGMSWTGGNNNTWRKCDFSNNCKGRCRANPGSGLDIEPERNTKCTNGRFAGCSFTHNGGYSVTTGDPADAYNVTFDTCRIFNTGNYTLFCMSPYFSFRNTQFVGVALLNFGTFTRANAPYFYKCSFTDSLKGYPYTYQTYIVALSDSARFESCTFNAWNSLFAYSQSTGAEFKNCTFNSYHNKWDPNFGRNCFLLWATVFNGCTFSKRDILMDYLSVLGDPVRHNVLINPKFKP